MLTVNSLCFFNDTATTEIYTLSLHDALPIFCEALSGGIRSEHELLVGAVDLAGAAEVLRQHGAEAIYARGEEALDHRGDLQDRKSTRLNSSHANISYAVFCLKKKHDKTTQL